MANRQLPIWLKAEGSQQFVAESETLRLLFDLALTGSFVPPGFVLLPEFFSQNSPSRQNELLASHYQTLQGYFNQPKPVTYRLIDGIGHYSKQHRTGYLDQLTAHNKAAFLKAAAQLEQERQRHPDLSQPVLLIQPSLEAEAAGFGYTEDPTGDDRTLLVVEAIFGDSQPLRTASLQPDRWRFLAENLAVVSHDINQQPWKLQASNQGNRHHPIARLNQTEPKLNQQEAETVAQLAQFISQNSNLPIKFEWLIDRSGQLWLTSLEKLYPPIERIPGEGPMANPALQGIGATGKIGTGPVRILKQRLDNRACLAGEIVVAETADLIDQAILERLSGIILETGRTNEPLMTEAKALKKPVVIAPNAHDWHLANGLYVTIDGQRGTISKGINTNQTDSNNGLNPIGSKVYTMLDQLDEAALVDNPADGIGLLPGELLFANLHHNWIEKLGQGPTKPLIRQLAEPLRAVLNVWQNKPVIYGLTNQSPADGHRLLGDRGTFHHLNQPALLSLELAVATSLYQKDGLTNLNLRLPMTRTYDEFLSLAHFILGSGLVADSGPKIWLNCQTPSTVMTIEQYCQHDLINGIIIDLETLSQLMLAFDRDQAIFAGEYQAVDESVIRAISHVVTAAKTHGLPVLLELKNHEQQLDFIEQLAGLGLTGFIVPPADVKPLRQLLGSVERQNFATEIFQTIHH